MALKKALVSIFFTQFFEKAPLNHIKGQEMGKSPDKQFSIAAYKQRLSSADSMATPYCDIFPVNPHVLEPYYDTRNLEHFQVNNASSESYMKYTIHYIQ